jgi:hypothetical protein
MFKKLLMATALAMPLAYGGAAQAQLPIKKPNIVVIWVTTSAGLIWAHTTVV